MNCLILILLTLNASFGQVNTENLRRTDISQGLHNSLEFDFGLVSGNSEYLNLTSGFRSDLVSGRYYSFGVIQYQRGIQDDEVFINKGFVHLRGIRELTSSFYGELFVQKEFNDFILLKDRNLIGGGLRIALLPHGNTTGRSSPIRVYAGIGTMWENEDIGTHPPEETSIFRSTNYASLSWRIDDRVYVGVVSYYQVHLGDFQDFRVLLESGFGYDVTRSIAFQVSFNLRYDNEPPRDVKKHDLEIKNGLRFSF
ncbi:MAG: DUF481 domain-containing protein [Candidatus Glassbacteria bacterium]